MVVAPLKSRWFGLIVPAAIIGLAFAFSVPRAYAGEGWSRQQSTDLPGSDIRSFELGPPQCAAECDKNAQCKAWTYVKPAGTPSGYGECWLKSAVPKEVPKPNCISGVKGMATAHRIGTAAPETDRPGSDIGPPIVFSDDYCEVACKGMANCRTFTLVKPNTIRGPYGLCYLKDAFPQPKKADCCISGWKTGDTYKEFQ